MQSTRSIERSTWKIRKFREDPEPEPRKRKRDKRDRRARRAFKQAQVEGEA